MSEKKTTKEKEYTVIADLLNVRNSKGEVVKQIEKGSIFKGTKKGDKIINEDGNTIVAKYVK
ncbi:MAG: hypothetical protein ACK5LC_11415 [Coprobacillaceae bacterium]